MLDFAEMTSLLFAQAAPAARPADNGLMTWLPLVWVPVLFYLFFIRPNMQQDKQRRQMLSAIKKNDRVITEAGIFGTVVSVDPETDRVVLRVDDDRGVKLTFLRSKVVKVLESAPDKDKDKDKEKTAEAV